MKSREEIEIAEHYYERHPLILTISVIATTLLVGTCCNIFFFREFEVHGWGLLLIPFALFSTFQTLIFILTPYAFIYKDRIEVKKNLFYNKVWYFNDIKKVSELGRGSFVITYNDGDEETMNLKGIKPSHLQNLRNELHRNVYETLVMRDLLN